MILFALLSTLLSSVLNFVSASDQILIERPLTLKTSSQAFSQTVCLEDLVEEDWIRGRCSREKKLCCLWTLEGQRSKEFNRADIEAAFTKLQIPGTKILLRGSDRILVTQTHRELSAAEVREKTLAALRRLPSMARAEISVSDVSLMSPIYIPLEKSDWDIQVPESIVKTNMIRIQLMAGLENQVLGFAKVTVAAEENVFIAKKSIRSQDLIRPEDFQLRKIDFLAPGLTRNESFVRQDEFPMNMRSKGLILAGSTLLHTSLERTPAVQLGEAVTLILRGDNLKIHTKGIVQSSAAVGDMINVQLKNYGRTFRGRLQEGKQVEVWF